MSKKFAFSILITLLGALAVLPLHAQNGCPAPADWTTYTVVRGDTLTAIARRTGSTVSALAAANCLSNPNLIHAGLVLRVPAASSAPTPQIARFWADKTTARPGDTITLQWEVRGRPNAILEVWDTKNTRGYTTGGGPQPFLTPDEIYTALPAIGRLTLTIPAGFNGDARFVLYAADANQIVGPTFAHRKQPSFTLDVPLTRPSTGAPQCHYSYFFTGGEGCPLNAAHEVQAAFQAFENGRMVWRSDRDSIYVLFSDGRARIVPPTAAVLLPDNPVREMPPAGRVSPVRGFGRVWGNQSDVRAAFGWALAAEQGYSARVQESLSAVQYFTLPDGVVIALSGDRWRRAN